MKQKGSGGNTVVCARAFFISKNYFGILSRTISRVMSWLRKSAAGIIIYLGRLSPAASSNLPKAGGPRQRFRSVLLRMGFTCAPSVARGAVVSYTALPPLPRAETRGGIFLLHCPWSRLRRTLSGILPCEARTFLTPKFGPRLFVLLKIHTWLLYTVF